MKREDQDDKQDYHYIYRCIISGELEGALTIDEIPLGSDYVYKIEKQVYAKVEWS